METNQGNIEGKLPTFSDAEMGYTGDAPVLSDSDMGYVSDAPILTDADMTKEDSPNYITENDISNIASKHGVSRDLLKQWVPKYGGEEVATAGTPGKEDIQQELGRVGEAVFLGIPQWIEKKITLDRTQQAAVDDLRKLVDEKKSGWERAGELALGLATPIPGAGLAAKAGAKGAAAIGAGIGGVYGLTHSDTGREIEGTLEGAGTGALGGAALHGAGRLAAKGLNSIGRKLASRDIERVSRELAGDPGTEDIINKQMQDSAVGEKAVSTAILEGDGLAAQKGADEVVSQVGGSRIYEEMKKISNPSIPIEQLSREGAMLRDKGAPLEEIRKSIAQDVVNQETVRFANYINRREVLTAQGKSRRIVRDSVGKIRDPEEAMAVVQQYAKETNDPAFLSREFETYRRATRQAELVADRLGGETVGESLPSRLLHGFLDAKYVYREIDRIHGTELSPLLDDMGNGYHYFTQDIADTENLIKELEARARKIGMSGTEITRTLEGSVSEVAQRISREEPTRRAILEDWVALQENMRIKANDIARGQGATKDWIPDLRETRGQNYTHHTIKNQVESLRALRAKERELGIEELDAPAMERVLTSPEGTPENEYLGALRILSGQDVADLSPDKLARVRASLGREETVATRILSTAAASKAREGEIPVWLREEDIGATARKWAYGTYRHLRMRDAIGRLKGAELALREGGDLSSAGYIADHLDDIMGSSRSSPANWAKKKVLEWRIGTDIRAEAAAREGATVKAVTWRIAGILPDLIRNGQSNMYPYYLGARIDAPLRNLTQPYAMTANEISTAAFPGYGYKQITKAQAETFAARLQGVDLEKVMRSEGHLSGTFTAESEDILGKAITEGTGLGGSISGIYKRSVEGLKKFSMSLYEMSDTRNRIVTHAAAGYVSDDLVAAIAKKRGGGLMSKDETASLSFLNSIPSGWRRRILRNAGDAEAVRKDVTTYLLSTTQFEYSRIAMSDYGRFMGGMFSMFTKWPTSIIGDIHSIVREGDMPRALQKGVQRYLGPLLGYYAIEEMFFDQGRDTSALKKKLVGKDLRSWAVAKTLTGLTDNLGKPPALDAAGTIISEIMSGKGEKALSNAGRAASSMVGPGIAIRFLTKDIAEWIDALQE